EGARAVDGHAEAEMLGASAKMERGRATTAIAHRVSTGVGATEILVLLHGEVRERGTHAELRAMHGLYDRLYRLQAGEVTERRRTETPDAKASSTALASPQSGG